MPSRTALAPETVRTGAETGSDLGSDLGSDTDIDAAAAALGWEVLDRIRRAGRDVEEMLVPDPVSGEPGPWWHPLSVDHGDLGLALVCAAADRLDPDGGWDEQAFGHVQRVVEAYRSTPGLGAGLFGGVGGVAYVLRALSRDGTRYRQALQDVEGALAERLADHLERLDPVGGLATADFDVVSGLSGVGTSLLTDPGRSGPLLDAVVASATFLARAALTPAPGGLWTPPDRITALERSHHQQLWSGYLNLGLAHGVAGVLVFLARVRCHGLEVPGLDAAVEVLADGLWARSRPTPYGPDTPYYETAGPSSRPQPELTRTAWCYGNPGTAIALAHAARAGLVRCESRVEELLASVAARPWASRGVDNVSLCHGLPGLALVQGRLGDAEAERETVRRLLQQADPDRPFGIAGEIAPGLPTDSPGFLEGAGGAAAFLVARGTGDDAPDPVELLLLGGDLR